MARAVLPPVPSPIVEVEAGGAARQGERLAVVHAGPDALTGAGYPHADLAADLHVTGKAGEVVDVPVTALTARSSGARSAGAPSSTAPSSTAPSSTAPSSTAASSAAESVGDGAPMPTWFVGVGDGEPARYRSAGAALVRAAHALAEAESDAGRRVPSQVAVQLPAGVDAEQAAAFTTGVVLGGYRFRVTGEKPKPAVTAVRFDGEPDEELTAAVARAREVAAASALARDLANAPSNVKNPAWLADVAARVAEQTRGLTATIRDETWLAEQAFGGMLAVGGGSASPPRLIELAYRPRGATSHLLLVGKGITFDTGGISIKPAAGMHLMRTDMAAGGAVIAAMRAIAALRLPVKVTALVPAAENHVSGSAYRPGDIVRHYGGRTSEVGNTDAEGRMVLADALGYGIQRFRPDAVVDVATLTGAMKVALGLRTGGVFATDDALAESVCAAGDRAGEQWWRMPLLEDHMGDVRSEIADVKQAAPGPGGVTAALFLREFAGGLPWAHLDIAGPARAEKTYDEVVPGGTGFGARTLVELAASYS
ncbi:MULTISPECIES: leucyl aminopeptidase family protein [Prauserella salsuginis group]|uniref:Probable cytosol aminopeptidase n=1 Tax=Prauserella salsuginis TaxID=387889 RepID=A0ABW6G6K2_9PSEU|nr:MULTISPECIES: M17 family metallopeptidase [Prauserella salsuginis group]MCR3722756.1 leucyl aminopeptidase [Prauserella flava]MCR3737189.1 leucyl aminopeptidase [Prauserella salsuginis]